MGIKIKKNVEVVAVESPTTSKSSVGVVVSNSPKFIKTAQDTKAILFGDESPAEYPGKKLFLQAEELKDRADQLMLDRASILLQLALETCPYKVGDYIRTNHGLGTGGLVIESVLASEYPSATSRWAIQTNAVAKDGSVSKCTLCLSEWQLNDVNTGIKVLEHRPVGS